MKWKPIKLKCHKCKKLITGDNVRADGRFDSVKGKIYCIDCYYTKARKKELMDLSVPLMDWVEKDDVAFITDCILKYKGENK